MNEITACVIAYNEELLLPGCLESLKGKVDRIVVVDGRIAGFPGDHGASTDRTVEIAQAAGAEVIESREPCWPDEVTKRNAYLREIGWQQYWLRIDADEELHGDLPGHNGTTMVDGSAYSLMLYREEDKAGYGVPCLFRRNVDTRYEGAHFMLFQGERLISKQPVPLVTSAFLLHRQARRPQERVQQKAAFHGVQNAAEGEARQRWGV
jgi:hypothetical protein